MADWKIEDRQNDWLAQEMAREGYVNNKSGLEKAHELEENSRDWNAGAIANARQHEERHLRALSKEKNQNKNNFSKSIVWMIFSFFLLGIISGIYEELPRYYRTNPFISTIYHIIMIFMFIVFIGNIIAFAKSMKDKGGK